MSLKKRLFKLLREGIERTDFGKEIIPDASKDYNVQAYYLMTIGKILEQSKHFIMQI
jgi:ADP-glucose pyrophosphorylase